MLHSIVRPTLHQSLAAALFLGLAGCARPVEVGTGTAPTPPIASTEPAPAAAKVKLGIDVLLERDLGSLRGKRIGLITNHTGVNAAGRSTIDLINEHGGAKLVALFGPEHGIRGTAEAGEHVEGGKDAKTGLPVYSLYGQVNKPTPEMLRDVDVLVFDIQDVGTRYYTYMWTMTLAMQAAAENGKKFVVLDRPNPIGGTQAQGNVLEMKHSSFVGMYAVPMRHGLTVGEMARFVNAEYRIGADLEVIPAEGWRRDIWYDRTGLPWTKPSPNMPTVESATHYPGTCLFEPVNLSVGRGTPAAFQQFGAPWLDTAELIRRLEAYHFPGVRYEAVTFTPQNPGDQRYGGELVKGVRLHTTDRATYDPTRVAVAVLVEIRKMHPDKLEIRDAGLDRLAGTSRLREMLVAGKSVDEITATWPAELAAYWAKARQYMLYE